ncbi:MAG: cobalamin biosynthesis protein [Methanobrevibacter woesei]|uniref:cobalamin biosynthesis protein n=1 Tax=Methanobrevibacter woesei TaxID=190976 RepID=UPI0023EF724E|nr:cobalamin biosynthesis protein [Methanobrevibacter woesei]MCI7292050.1 cobalamin biosynthesis protein [Methanobrevibacter woesei]
MFNFINFDLFLFTISTLVFAIVFDIIIGELPSKIHPVVIIGKIIDFFTGLFIKIRNKFSGLLLFLSTTIVSTVILFVLFSVVNLNFYLMFIVYGLLLSSTFSIKILLSSANDISNNLKEGIEKARKSVSYLVSRNTNELSEKLIVSATIESLTENITDSYISPIFYFTIISVIALLFADNINTFLLVFVILWIPFLFRISNTLDAMVGYENDKLKYIGYFPAKVDDILNYIPARIAGFLVVVSAFILKLNWKNSYKIMLRDARNCPSPNSGFTMASTAGALNIQLVKKDTYILGDNTVEIDVLHISKAIKLSKFTILLFTIISFLILILIELLI